jgi:Family of unknown function (DUF5995)
LHRTLGTCQAGVERGLDLRPAARITEVIARLKRLVAALPPDDGVRAFTKLYLAVTEAVQEEAKPGAFGDVRDVVFANLYFEALRNALLPPTRCLGPGRSSSRRAGGAAFCHCSSCSRA